MDYLIARLDSGTTKTSLPAIFLFIILLSSLVSAIGTTDFVAPDFNPVKEISIRLKYFQ